MSQWISKENDTIDHLVLKQILSVGNMFPKLAF